MRGQELGGENGQNTEFMTVFSHELRNSLCAIRFAVGILRMETSTRSAALNARTVIERQVAQMTRLVEDLLDVSRVRRGQLALRRERVDLCAVVAHAAQTVAFTMRERKHRMSTSFPDAPVWIQADPARLEQVFVNLLFECGEVHRSGWPNPALRGNRNRVKRSFEYATVVSGSRRRICPTCLLFSSRQIRLRVARRQAWVSGSRWYALWSNVMVAVSLPQVPAAGREASSPSGYLCSWGMPAL